MVKVKKEIRAVYEKNFDEVLEELGILDDFRNGKLTCLFCNNVVTIDNLGALIYYNNKIELICNNEICMKKAMALSK